MMELDHVEKKIIEKKVAVLLAEYGYDPDKDDYVNIIDFTQKLDFSVGNALLSDSEDGFLAISPSSDAKGSAEKVIGVNVNRSLEFKRFIIAHEFAHSVLHYQDGRVFLHRENKRGKDEGENDADYFAAALLMPQASFQRMYRAYKAEARTEADVYLKLAKTFGVPVESVLRRIDEVNVTA